MGTDVFSAGRSGPTARVRRKGRNPKTVAQTQVRANLTKASGTFKNLTTPQILAWANYAGGITKHNGVTGKSYSPTALSAYTALASKLLQINPAATLPVAPPTATFTGDSITVTATGGTGSATFTASGANAANVKTELLVQPLKSKNRAPSAKGYRSKGFVAFAAGSLTSVVSVPTGYYSVGYRFVNTLTGQATALVPLTVLTVALSVEDGGLVDAQNPVPAPPQGVGVTAPKRKAA